MGIWELLVVEGKTRTGEVRLLTIVSPLLTFTHRISEYLPQPSENLSTQLLGAGGWRLGMGAVGWRLEAGG